jgi:hypothetical protein
MSELETKKPLPRWLVLVVVLATGGITAAAMFATGLRGPAMAWERASKGAESVWAGDPQGIAPTPVQVPASLGVPAAQPPSPPPAQPAVQAATQPMTQPPVQSGTAMGAIRPGPVMPVAAQPGVPVIIWGTPIGHGDRGPCTNCHGVIMPQGMPVPAISALSVMPHAYRGVCNNCHEVKVMPLGAPVAGLITVPPTAAPAEAPPRMRAPTEAEWLGLEVGVAPQGVLVNGVEAMAKRAGMRVGDVITSINAVPVRTVADFVAVTQNGGLMQGTIIARREGQRLAFELGPRQAQPQPQPQAMQMAPNQMAPNQEPQGRERQVGQVEQNQEPQGRERQVAPPGIPLQAAEQQQPVQPPAAGAANPGVAQRAPEAPF